MTEFLLLPYFCATFETNHSPHIQDTICYYPKYIKKTGLKVWSKGEKDYPVVKGTQCFHKTRVQLAPMLDSSQPPVILVPGNQRSSYEATDIHTHANTYSQALYIQLKYNYKRNAG